MSPRDIPLAQFRPPIVLVVEDRPMSRSATGRLASVLGYEVRGARNGEQALALVRDYPALFDLVLTNILLPDMDGGNSRGESGSISPASGWPGSLTTCRSGKPPRSSPPTGRFQW